MLPCRDSPGRGFTARTCCPTRLSGRVSQQAGSVSVSVGYDVAEGCGEASVPALALGSVPGLTCPPALALGLRRCPTIAGAFANGRGGMRVVAPATSR